LIILYLDLGITYGIDEGDVKIADSNENPVSDSD
jgi:hypothetical protein